MRYILIAVVILAGIAASLGVYFTGLKPETIIVEADMIVEPPVLYVEGKMTFCIDSIVNKQVYLTQLETSNKIILEEKDIFIVTHTVRGESEPKEEKDAIGD